MDDNQKNLLRALSASDGAAYWFLGTLVTIKATADDTRGAFSLLDQLAPPGFGPPLHVHSADDEVFFIMEGEVRFRCGDKGFFVQPGGYVFLPKSVPHAFRVEGSSPAKLLQMTLPAGFDGLVRDIGTPALTRTLPPPAPMPADVLQRMIELGPKYQFSVIGPPLDAAD